LVKQSILKTLSEFAPNRSILPTASPPYVPQNRNHKLTIHQIHSMEEADALADRVGVMAQHMLDIGTISHLRTKHGYGFHVQLVLRPAPTSSEDKVCTVLNGSKPATSA
jgi:ATP-binding cassette, subfamily A (ABC1), member 3